LANAKRSKKKKNAHDAEKKKDNKESKRKESNVPVVHMYANPQKEREKTNPLPLPYAGKKTPNHETHLNKAPPQRLNTQVCTYNPIMAQRLTNAAIQTPQFKTAPY
jgi:hypothetical protein